MLNKIVFSLIKWVPLRVKKQFLENSNNVQDALINLKISLKNLNTNSSKKVLNQINSNYLYQQAQKILDDCNQNGIHIIFYTDIIYPKDLIHCEDAPIILYAKGRIFPKEATLVSIVGTRNCSEYGMDQCKEIVSFLSNYNVELVSGLAYGIDIYTHQLANKFNIVNYAVLGSGIMNIYPKNHYHEGQITASNGMIISEYTPFTGPKSYHFPKRNRIIAGMSKCTVVIESPKKGGAIITARLANDYNKEVFAVPGNNYQKQSSGNNWLIEKHHATILNQPQQIVEFLELLKKPPSGCEIRKLDYKKLKNITLNNDEKRILNLISKKNTISFNEIQLQLQIQTAALTVLMTNLEIKQLIKAKFGNFYQLNNNAFRDLLV